MDINYIEDTLDDCMNEAKFCGDEKRILDIILIEVLLKINSNLESIADNINGLN